ncbi:hypothetical protein PTT_07440 [Paecilomyces variotii No. 5]|uniref:Uncharacterized protein n=1 Tax=Byssochlamys spectabilis (strain No. 5 / NBRC 109023) TaxID=1356009 RepID=V5GCE9_BYSSN|nr:hypothetical protein PTT_07440 [Paecilomyces variotii No. 5]
MGTSSVPLTQAEHQDTSPMPVADENIKRDSKKSSFNGWRFRWLYELATTLRVLGLQLIIYPLGRYLGVYREQPKIVIRRNKLSALLRALIHLIPVAASIGLIIVNIRGYYLGGNVDDVGLIQFAAKGHELFIQASLTFIITNVIASQLVSREGLPFGTLFSISQLSQVGYLFSSALFGSLLSFDHLTVRAKSIIGLTIAAIILATTAGPSSAILMIPQVDPWPAGSTHFYINATPSEIWPDKVDTSTLRDVTSCRRINDPLLSNDCPGSEYGQLMSYFTLQNHTATQPAYLKYYSHYLGKKPSTPGSIHLSGKNSLRPLSILNPEFLNVQSKGFTPSQVSLATVPQAAVSDALVSVADLWLLALGSLDWSVESSSGTGLTSSMTHYKEAQRLSSHQSALHMLRGAYQQPYVATNCEYGRVNITDLDESVLVQPSLGQPGNWPSWYGNSSVYQDPPDIPENYTKMPNLTWSTVFSAPGSNQSDYRSYWYGLDSATDKTGNPIGDGNTPSLFVFVIPPIQEENVTALDFQLCSATAGWAASNLNVTSDSTLVNQISSTAEVNNSITDLPAYNWFSQKPVPLSVLSSAFNFGFRIPDFPQRHISISSEWADLLNPIIPRFNTNIANDANISHTAGLVETDTDVLANLISISGLQRGDSKSFAAIISAMIANGLSRTSFDSALVGNISYSDEFGTKLVPDWLHQNKEVFNLDGDQNNRSSAFTKLDKQSYVIGYSFRVRGTASILAITILIAYCLLAIGHVLVAGFTGFSTDSLSSTTELVALAMNSPAELSQNTLKNTGAGMSGVGAFKARARLRTIAADDDGDDDDYKDDNDDDSSASSLNTRVASIDGSSEQSRERLVMILDDSEGGSETDNDEESHGETRGLKKQKWQLGYVEENREYG